MEARRFILTATNIGRILYTTTTCTKQYVTFHDLYCHTLREQFTPFETNFDLKQ